MVPKTSDRSGWLTLTNQCMYHASLRTYLQIETPAFHYIAGLLQVEDYRREIACPCMYCLGHSFINRHRVGQPGRPKVLLPVVARGYRESLGHVYHSIMMTKPNLRPKPLDRIPFAYSGAKRKAAEKTVQRIKDEGGLVGRIYMKPFIKKEKGAYKLTVKDTPQHYAVPGTRPRAIVPQMMRHPDGHESNAPVLLELTFGAPLEYVLENMRNPDGTRMFASGRTLKERASDITAMFRPGHVCLSIDLSSFDGSQADLAILERAAFLAFWRSKGEDVDELEKVLDAQNMFSFSVNGLRGQVYGNRASGTGRTSSGNKVVMMAALWQAFRRASDVTYYCDGDDTLIFLPIKKMKRRIRAFLKRMSRLGLETKIEGIAYDVPDVVFCRAQIVEFEDGPMLIKNPGDAFSSMTAIINHFKGPELWSYLSSVACSYKHVYAGVPILGELHSLYPNDGIYRASLMDSWHNQFYQLNKNTCQKTPMVSSASRKSFERTFGVSRETQIRIEGLLRKLGDSMPAAIQQRTSIMTTKPKY